MFTGLVQAVGEVVRVDPDPAGVRLEIDGGPWAGQADLVGGRGASVCVSGCCLTVAGEPLGGRLAFVVVPETLAKTTLGAAKIGSRVNLEASLSASALLGGHLVQGHIDATGDVSRVTRPGPGGGEWRLRIEPPAGLMKFMTPKGSVCLDGVSLTIAALHPGDRHGQDGWIEVALIPETLDKTTLGALVEGDRVNIEADAMTKTVVHVVEHYLIARGLDGPTLGTGSPLAGRADQSHHGR